MQETVYKEKYLLFFEDKFGGKHVMEFVSQEGDQITATSRASGNTIVAHMDNFCKCYAVKITENNQAKTINPWGYDRPQREEYDADPYSVYLNACREWEKAEAKCLEFPICFRLKQHYDAFEGSTFYAYITGAKNYMFALVEFISYQNLK